MKTQEMKNLVTRETVHKTVKKFNPDWYLSEASGTGTEWGMLVFTHEDTEEEVMILNYIDEDGIYMVAGIEIDNESEFLESLEDLEVISEPSPYLNS